MASPLSDIQRGAINSMVDHALYDKLQELNAMADRLPTLKSLPDVLAKAFGQLEAAALKMVGEVEAMGEHGTTVLGNVGNVVKDARSTFDEVAKSIEGGGNGAPPLASG